MDLGPVHAHHEQACHEGTENLREDVVGHFSPWETLPDGETYCDGWVEVAAGCGCTGYDGEGDADGEGPADLEDATEGCDADGLGGVQVEGRDCCDAGEAG